MTLCSSNLQFGFKKGTSTTQCTFSMLETIDHYNFIKSNAFVLMLDASKSFDGVNYCKLFRSCCNVFTLGIVVCGQLVEMSDTAVHLGHTITSKSSFWKSFNILIAEFGKLSPFVISKLFNQYCCSFYGSPLWSISGAAVQGLCVDWRKALRSMWRLNPRTHCDLNSFIEPNNIIIIINSLLQTNVHIHVKKRYI